MAGGTRGMVLFCGDPLGWTRGGAVDPAYATEAEAAQRAGFETALLDFEALVDGQDAGRAIRHVPAAHDDEGERLALYRGWMLRPDAYRLLYEALAERGVRLITDPAAYRHCHYLPEWYPALEGHTPRTVWLPLSEKERRAPPLDRVMEALRPFGNEPVLVKDYVKSRKHEWAEACFIPSAASADDVRRVVSRFLELQGPDLNEGLVFREFVDLQPLGTHAKSGMPVSVEWRLFFFAGQPVWGGAYWEGLTYRGGAPSVDVLVPVATRVRSRFFAMDVAQLMDGTWTVMELGDGQVSGLPELEKPYAEADAELLYRQLAARWPAAG